MSEPSATPRHDENDSQRSSVDTPMRNPPSVSSARTPLNEGSATPHHMNASEFDLNSPLIFGAPISIGSIRTPQRLQNQLDTVEDEIPDEIYISQTELSFLLSQNDYAIIKKREVSQPKKVDENVIIDLTSDSE